MTIFKKIEGCKGMRFLVIFGAIILSVIAQAKDFPLEDIEQISQLTQYSKDISDSRICGLTDEQQLAFDVEFQQVWRERIATERMKLTKKSPKEKYAIIFKWNRCISKRQCRIYSFILEEYMQLGPKALKLKERIDKSASKMTTEDIASHSREISKVCKSQTFNKIRNSISVSK